MLPHRFQKHRSARSLVREFFKEQLEAGITESLLTMPAHPSSENNEDLSYKEMLQAIKSKQHWGFSRVTFRNEKPIEATIHYWAGSKATEEDLVRMFAHELGHISGKMQKPGSKDEEDRADSYAEVAYAVVNMLKSSNKKKIKN